MRLQSEYSHQDVDEKDPALLGHGLCCTDGSDGSYHERTVSHTQKGHQETEDSKHRTIQSLTIPQVAAVEV